MGWKFSKAYASLVIIFSVSSLYIIKLTLTSISSAHTTNFTFDSTISDIYQDAIKHYYRHCIAGHSHNPAHGYTIAQTFPLIKDIEARHNVPGTVHYAITSTMPCVMVH